jgi:hypothetical protein
VPGGLFLGDGGPITQVARMGQPAPDGNGFFSTLQGQLNNAGQVLITAQLNGTQQGTADNTALYVYDEGQLTKIVRTGDEFEVAPGDRRTIASFDVNLAPLAPLPLNNHGQIAFPLRFTDGSSGIFLATVVPEPAGNHLVSFAMLSAVVLRRRFAARDSDKQAVA